MCPVYGNFSGIAGCRKRRVQVPPDVPTIGPGTATGTKTICACAQLAVRLTALHKFCFVCLA
jgi:hypothetical protein